MKNFVVRLAVLALATTGFASSTMISKVASKQSKVTPVVFGTITPTPMCMPSSGKTCGMD